MAAPLLAAQHGGETAEPFSGVEPLEKNLEATKPTYRDYVRRTNAFFPGPPKA